MYFLSCEEIKTTTTTTTTTTTNIGSFTCMYKSKEFFTYEMFPVLFPANKTYTNKDLLFICNISRLVNINDRSLAIVNYAIEYLLCWKKDDLVLDIRTCILGNPRRVF